MQIKISNLGKKYAAKNWIFRDFSENIASGEDVAIVGNNGSGKSTLLSIIGGSVLPSAGTIEFHTKSGTISSRPALGTVSYAAPYLDLVHEFTVREHLDFHFKFRKTRDGRSIEDLLNIMYLEGHEYKFVKNLSSGMRQRLKLSLAIFSEAELVLLDEPTSNLDKAGQDWYMTQTNAIRKDCTLIIASNQPAEYSFCDKIIDMNMTLAE